MTRAGWTADDWPAMAALLDAVIGAETCEGQRGALVISYECDAEHGWHWEVEACINDGHRNVLTRSASLVDAVAEAEGFVNR